MPAALTPLEGIDSSSRLLRTSIYLKNSLSQSDGNVKDLLDCVAPIVNDSINQLPLGQIVLSDLQKIMQSRFSFKMPTFSLEHVLGRLVQGGKIKYESDQKAYFHSRVESHKNLTDEETAVEKISFLENEMANYANAKFKIIEPLFFSKWADILVHFLHPDAINASSLTKNFKGTLITDFNKAIRNLASNFILDCRARDDQKLFNIIIEVYGGVLLGDFLQNVQSTGDSASFKKLIVYYDTSVLLRLLGCSGSELRNANMEMHRDLQSLGCKTEFLQHNESEVANILDTIVRRYDSHLLIYGETGEALADKSSNVSIGMLRSLKDGYPEELATLNVFQSNYTFQNTKAKNLFQIDELKFEDMLKMEGAGGYSDENSRNDAQSLAVVMRLRQNTRPYDLANSKVVFVTSNSHFARTARKFIRSELGFTSRYVPPILTHAQISIAAWMLSETKLLDSFISRELLANCMSAQQLSKEWVDSFLNMMKDAPLPEDDKTLLYAVRSIARDESLGNPTILRRLNPNDMIRHAQEAEERRRENQLRQHKNEVEVRVAEHETKVRSEERREFETAGKDRAEKISRSIIRGFEYLFVAICAVILFLGSGDLQISNYRTWIQPTVFAAVILITVLDLFQFRPVQCVTNPMRKKLASVIFRLFYSGS